jgi:isopentenyl-diphosphate delta-isomerase
LFGNIGVVQAATMSTAEVEELVGSVGADALCVHMNPGQEIVQEEGDRDFRGAIDALGRLATELSVPVIAKETGCGVSGGVARRLASVGVRHVDVSGAGGTSWVAVETERATTDRRRLGEAFREWGIPTAASVAFVAQQGFSTIIATGGMKSGLDVARAIALGAHAGGFARPVLQALDAEGREGAVAFLALAVREIQTAMLLTGSPDLAALARAPRVVTGALDAWVHQASPRSGAAG